MSESGGNSTKKQYRPSSSKSRSRPTTAEYDRALQEDIMEEGNVDSNPRSGQQGPSTQVSHLRADLYRHEGNDAHKFRIAQNQNKVTRIFLGRKGMTRISLELLPIKTKSARICTGMKRMKRINLESLWIKTK